jgi:cystathionine beta-lyase
VDGRPEIDWDDLEQRMSKPDVKVTILCNPHNPTGRVWSRGELTRYGELALKHKVVVLADEIHCDFIQKGQTYTPFSTLDPAIVHNSVTFKSGSKAFSLAAMKCAWFFSTNPELFDAVVANNHSEMTTLGIVAEQAAYAGGGDWLTACTAYVDANHDLANGYIKAKLPLMKVGQKPEGTYLEWVDVSPLAERIGARKLADAANANLAPGATPATSEDMCAHWLARHAHVSMASGTGFGKGGANHLRMNIATSRRTLTAALDSMQAAMAALG